MTWARYAAIGEQRTSSSLPGWQPWHASCRGSSPPRPNRHRRRRHRARRWPWPELTPENNQTRHRALHPCTTTTLPSVPDAIVPTALLPSLVNPILGRTPRSRDSFARAVPYSFLFTVHYNNVSRGELFNTTIIQDGLRTILITQRDNADFQEDTVRV
jgi:hypothetical protein